MCESKAYIIKNGKEELLLEDVELIKVDEKKVLVRNILGEEKIVQACVKEISFTDHKVILGHLEG